MSPEQDLLAGIQLRPMWRFLFSAALMFVAYSGVATMLGLVFDRLEYHPGFLFSLFWFTFALAPALLGLCGLLTKALEQKPLASIGLAFHSRWKKEFGIGLIIGTAMISAVAVLEYLFGAARFSWSGQPPSALLAATALVFAILAVAAFNEEVTFRGYSFQRLLEAAGPLAAVTVSSAVFGIVHLANPHHTWVSTLNTTLVGIPLAVGYLRTRMLWLPIGLHFAWNFVLGYVLGLPVSGAAFPETILIPKVRGAIWLTGGLYGPEGSVLASGAIVLAAVYLLFSKSIYVTEEAKTLVFGRGLEMPAARSTESSVAQNTSITSNSSGHDPQ